MKTKDNLSLQQELFCNYYVSKEFFGNWVNSYAEAYNINLTKKWAYESCKSEASRLLTNDNVLKRINTWLDNEWLNDQFVDKQLLFLLTQHKDFTAKIWAIKEYNKLKQRITEKIELSAKSKFMEDIYNNQKED